MTALAFCVGTTLVSGSVLFMALVPGSGVGWRGFTALLLAASTGVFLTMLGLPAVA